MGWIPVQQILMLRRNEDVRVVRLIKYFPTAHEIVIAREREQTREDPDPACCDRFCRAENIDRRCL